MKRSIRYSQWHRYIAHMSNLRQYGVTLVTLIALAAFWYSLIFKPIQQAKKYYHNKNQVTQQEITIKESNSESIVQLSKKIQHYNNDLDLYVSPSCNINEIVINAVNQAQKQNLVIESCTIEPITSKEWYNLAPMSISVYGPIQSITQWLQTLLGSCKFCNLTTLNMQSVDNNQMRCSLTLSYMTTQKA